MVKRPSVAFFLIIGLLVPGPILKSQTQAESSPGSPHRPRLIVLLTIDQFPYNYLVRFRPYFEKGGFNLLLSGANFIDTKYDDAVTATCPGHAALSTGAYSAVNGIIGNEWYERSNHRQVNCVQDDSTKLVGGPQGSGRSPARLIGDTFTDELRLETDFKSRVVSVSLKDRGAIIPGGHTANAAYWYDVESGHFVTSTYYMSFLPKWAAEFNASQPAKAYCGKPWQSLQETPGAEGRILEQFQEQGDASCPGPRFLAWLNETPAMSEIQLDFARKAVAGEHLGQGPATDVLAISLSENDHVGHRFGPYSPEVADMTLRTDRDLADFFAYLDQTVGLDNIWVVFSADHGVAPTPEFIRQHKLGAGRVSQYGLMRSVNQALVGEFGPGDWIEGSAEFEIYLNHSALEAHGINLGRAQLVATEAAAALPNVASAYSRAQIMTGNLPDTPIARKVAHAYNSERGGDVFLVFAPYAVPIETSQGTTHGSPWSYDAQVPLIFWGSGFKSGIYSSPAAPIDLPATLCAALGIGQPSGSEGRPLREAIR